jgi:membrane protein
MTGEGNQGVRDAELAEEASGAKPDPQPTRGIAGLVTRVFEWRPLRVWFHYLEDNGPLLASGLTYQAIFALFAALWLGFSIAGFVVKGDPHLQDLVFGSLNRFIPGLIGYGGDGNRGLVSAKALTETTALSWSTAISLIGVVFTAIGFVGSLRTAIRIMFRLGPPSTIPILLILINAGYTVAFGVVVLLTAVISLLANTVLSFVLGLFGLGRATAVEQIGATAVSVLVLLLIDTGLVAAAFRALSGLRIPRRRLLVGAIIGGVGLAVLQTLGTSLLGGATSNPLLKAFATLIGIFLYFNLICQIVLVAASWIAVGMEEARLDPRSLSAERREADDAEALERARRLVADRNREALEQRVRAARGARRDRLQRELEREVRAEEARRAAVPTRSEFARAQHETGDPDPDAEQVQEATAGSSGAAR